MIDLRIVSIDHMFYMDLYCDAAFEKRDNGLSGYHAV